jgi:hypothetical protein
MFSAQQPLQMLLTVRSSLRFSASIFASLVVSELLVEGDSGIRVPFGLSPPLDTPLELAVPREFVPVELPAFPLVDCEPVDGPEPDELTVSRFFMPGEVGTFAALPAPLGSLPELFRPPTLAGPLGTPLTPAVPAPAEPAFGEPAALPEPFVGPLAAPPAAAPPAVPPAEPPPELPPPPPPPWARADVDPIAKISAKAINFFKATSCGG